MQPIGLSVVIPIFNEQENLRPLATRLRRSLDATGESWEVIFVNDASRDDSLALMRRLSAKDPRFRAVSLSRNFGHQTAITAGMAHARGQAVVLMDGDLQDPPEVVPQLLEKMKSGRWDVVFAVRRKRKEPAAIRFLYFAFYRLLRRMSSVDIPLDSGDFCIMSRRVADTLNRLPERNRFVRGLRSWVGFRQTGMEYERAARHAGSPKYTLKSLVKLAFDGIFSFSYLPLRLSTTLGLVVSVLGLLYAAFVVLARVLGAYQQIPGWTTVVVAVLVLGGVQLVMLGLVGEYMGRVYDEIKGRPSYLVDELIGFDDAPRRAE
ncbi:MAG: polyisoprenyl-phosphate glycosyltransferase [Candidatus Sumerlaeota bacterium]|nr:polyisoprenyl-phosphate glycosyltransferase [Candidatus Sumerlaeota bacterium]